MRKLILAAASGAAILLLGAGIAAAAGAVPAFVAAAVADTSRSDADRARDADRKPAEVLAFSGVKAGQKVGELIPGGGYYTKLLSDVVGASGHVYALWPAGFAKARPQLLEASGKVAPNVTAVTYDGNALNFPEKLDLFWTSENYHDLHNAGPGGGPPPDVAGFNKAVFAALKPGGIYLIEDHAAAAGAGPDATSKLHRIDPAQVKSEVEAAGFKLVGESDVLKRPADPHTDPVFNPAIRGHTDKLLFKFRKP